MSVLGDKPVRGHLCPELQRLQAEGGGCEPDIQPNGTIRGCDSTNPIPINFCPMCGKDLRHP